MSKVKRDEWQRLQLPSIQAVKFNHATCKKARYLLHGSFTRMLCCHAFSFLTEKSYLLKNDVHCFHLFLNFGCFIIQSQGCWEIWVDFIAVSSTIHLPRLESSKKLSGATHFCWFSRSSSTFRWSSSLRNEEKTGRVAENVLGIFSTSLERLRNGRMKWRIDKV